MASSQETILSIGDIGEPKLLGIDRKLHPRTRFFTIRKTRRAVSWSQKLLVLCRQYCPPTSILEAQTYHAMLEGYAMFEAQKWHEATLRLALARDLLFELHKTYSHGTPIAYEVILSPNLYRQKGQQLAQSVKFCEWKKGGKGEGLSVGAVMEMRAKGQPGLAAVLETLTSSKLQAMSISGQNQFYYHSFRHPLHSTTLTNQKMAIERSLRELQQFRDANLSTNKSKGEFTDMQQMMDIYSKVINAVINALDAVTAERNALIKTQASPAPPSTVTNVVTDSPLALTKFSHYLNELKLRLLIDRNQTVFTINVSQSLKESNENNQNQTNLIPTLKMNSQNNNSPQTLSKLLSNTSTYCQNIIDLLEAELTELGHVANSPLEEKGSIQSSNGSSRLLTQISSVHPKSLLNWTTSLQFYLRTLRLVYVAEVYLNNQKAKEAYSLYKEAQRGLVILENGLIDNPWLSLENIKKLIQIGQIKSTLLEGGNGLETLKKQNKMQGIQSQLEGLNLKDAISLQEKLLGGRSGRLVLEGTIMEGSGECNRQDGKQDKKRNSNQVSPVLSESLHTMLLLTRPIFYDVFFSTLEYPPFTEPQQKQTTKKSWWNVFG